LRPVDASVSRGRLKWAAYAIVSIVLVAVLSVGVNAHLRNSSTSASGRGVSVSGELITPPVSLPDAQPILATGPVGARLTDINVPLNATELAVINDAANSFFVTAAQMYLNHTLDTKVGFTVHAAPPFIVNGKPTVTYLGSISCPGCAENGWAMALALSRFGSFQQLFKGYSALWDGDVPTLYWAPAHYNASSATEFGNFYVGKYVNFVSIEYSSPIRQGFKMETLSYFQQESAALGNPIYSEAMNVLIGLNDYIGTPDTIWGSYNVPGADSMDVGVGSFPLTSVYPMASLTHDQILSSLAHPSTDFAWTEYAAADYYVALVCASGNVSAPVCSLPYVSTMVSQVHA
jgi:Domain of unknown function (DUF929)